MSGHGRTAVETTEDPTVRRTWKFTPMIIGGDVPPGPWDREPDKVTWVDTFTDLDCMMLRNPVGAWCGYVGVPQTHRLHGVAHFVCPPLDVHGGVTFSGLCSPGEPVDGICHVAQPGREPAPWWFGFDCSHFNDAAPVDFFVRHKGSDRLGAVMGAYRTEGYTMREVVLLATQLAVIR